MTRASGHRFSEEAPGGGVLARLYTRTSLTLLHEVYREPDDVLVFTARITYVCVKVAAKAPVPVPAP